MASFLPSIRCSDCGLEVELSLMGEHVCSKQSERKILRLRTGLDTDMVSKAAPFTQLRIAQVLSKSPPETASNGPLPFKATRAPPPPRLQTNAIGTPQKSGHGSTGTDNVQVVH